MKLRFTDTKMLELISHLKRTKGLTQQSILEKIDFPAQNISQVKTGLQSFKVPHFEKAIEVFNLDANFFFKKDAPMFYAKKELTAKDHLQEALRKIK